MLVQYSHLTGPLVGAKRENFDVYWFIGPLCILCQVLTFDLTNKMLMHVNKNVVCKSHYENQIIPKHLGAVH